jgi:hypothetical protein
MAAENVSLMPPREAGVDPGAAWSDPSTRQAFRRNARHRLTQMPIVFAALVGVYTVLALVGKSVEDDQLVFPPSSPGWLEEAVTLLVLFVVFPAGLILPLVFVASAAGLAEMGLARRRLRRYPWRSARATFGQIGEKPFIRLAEEHSPSTIPYVFSIGFSPWRRRAKPVAHARGSGRRAHWVSERSSHLPRVTGSSSCGDLPSHWFAVARHVGSSQVCVLGSGEEDDVDEAWRRNRSSLLLGWAETVRHEPLTGV